MSIDYYVIDKHSRHVFDIGQHRHEYADAVRKCVTEAKPYKTYVEFFEMCMEPARKHDAVVPGYSTWVARKAPLVWEFIAAASFDVLLLDDSGDDLDAYDDSLVVGSVFDSFTQGRTLAGHQYDDDGVVRDRDDSPRFKVPRPQWRQVAPRPVSICPSCAKTSCVYWRLFNESDHETGLLEKMRRWYTEPEMVCSSGCAFDTAAPWLRAHDKDCEAGWLNRLDMIAQGSDDVGRDLKPAMRVLKRVFVRPDAYKPAGRVSVFIVFNEHTRCVAVFSNEEKATAWLKAHADDSERYYFEESLVDAP